MYIVIESPMSRAIGCSGIGCVTVVHRKLVTDLFDIGLSQQRIGILFHAQYCFGSIFLERSGNQVEQRLSVDETYLVIAFQPVGQIKDLHLVDAELILARNEIRIIMTAKQVDRTGWREQGAAAQPQFGRKVLHGVNEVRKQDSARAMPDEVDRQIGRVGCR